MSLRTVIVDDEPLARDLLSAILSDDADVELVSVSDNGEDAVRAILETKPDVVFLDINMPEMSGLEVAAILMDGMDAKDLPEIIFATAYEQYAVEAFRVNALDYILKPLSDDDVRRSLSRVRNRLLQASISPMSVRLQKAVQSQIRIQNGDNLILVEPKDLIRLQAQGDYVELYLSDRKRLIRATLKSVEVGLPHDLFQRVHRSTIINLDAIREVKPAPKGTALVILKDGQSVPVSRTYAAELRGRLV